MGNSTSSAIGIQPSGSQGQRGQGQQYRKRATTVGGRLTPTSQKQEPTTVGTIVERAETPSLEDRGLWYLCKNVNQETTTITKLIENFLG